MGCEINENKKEIIRFTFFCIFICIIWCVVYVQRLAPELADPDCYTRLDRVQRLYGGEGWYQSAIPRSNAPYGESFHWTRPFDVLLLAGALPGTIFVDFRTALFWWGVVISPVLLVALMMVTLWATKPLLSRQGPFLVGILLFFQTGLMAYCQPGRPDQHSLLVLLFVALFGFGLRFVSGPVSRGLCCAAGVVGGVAMWSGLELIVVVFAIAAILGLLWIGKRGDFARKSFDYSVWVFIAVGISLLIERPLNDITTMEFDRLSIMHWSVCGFVAGFWIIAGLINRFSEVFERRTARLVFAVVGVVVTAVCVLLLFPKMAQSNTLNYMFPKLFGSGQVADVDPRIIKIWYEKISEMQHIFSKGAPIGMSVQFGGTAVVSVGFLLYLLGSSNCKNKRGWVFVSAMMAVYVPFSIYRIRWTPYGQFLLMLPMAEMMDRVLKRIEIQKPGIVRVLKNVSVVAGFSATFFVLGLAAAMAVEGKQTEDVSIVKICYYLNEDEKWQGKTMRILTNISFGPEIIYRTRHETIGSPHHCNGSGILDTYDVMAAENDEVAHKIIKQRGIELILLVQNSPEFRDFLKAEGESAFYKRLFRNEHPSWLKEVGLPNELSATFKLFEVTENAAAGVN